MTAVGELQFWGCDVWFAEEEAGKEGWQKLTVKATAAAPLQSH